MDQRMLVMILNSIGDGVITTDPEGVITGMNPAAEKLIGIREGEASGCDIDDIFHLHHKRNGERIRCLWKEALSDQEPLSLVKDVVLRQADGEEKVLSAKYAPIRECGRKPEGVVIVFRDVTRMREKEEQLRLFQTALEQSPNSILMTDAQNRIVYVNEQMVKLTGYTREELMGNTPARLKSGNTPPGTYADLWQSLEACRVWSGEFYNRKKNGEHYWEQAIVAPIADESGIITHYLAIKEDITHKKAMMEELNRTRVAAEENLEKSRYYMHQLEKARRDAEAANRAKSEFLASMSHEIRTPLNGITGMLELLQMSRLEREQQENLEIIRVCSENLLDVINSILDLSKIEAGKMELEKHVFSISEWFERCLSVHRVQALRKGIRLVGEMDDRLPGKASGDSKRMQQVMNNLIGNAVKFTDRGQVTVRCTLDSDSQEKYWVTLMVKDTGIGIPAREMPRIFDSFTQLDGSINRRYGGTGLGLSITRKLTELMGGTIAADSVYGSGTTFMVSLPLDPAETDKTAHVSSKQKNRHRKQVEDVTVLLAEDDEINLVVVSSLLKAMGYSPICVSNGKEAVEAWKRHQPDVVLMDIQMPEMDGIQATRTIRSMEEAEEGVTPIVAVTAHAVSGDRERFLKAGMSGYLSKPIEMESLGETIQQALAASQNSERKPGSSEQQEFQAVPEENLADVIREEATKTFMAEMLRILGRMETALKNENYESVEGEAHQVKLLALQAGEFDIKSRAFKLELSARKAVREEAEDALRGLQESFESYAAFVGQDQE